MSATPPRLNLVVTIDVEEDNWGFDRRETSTENIRRIPQLQKIFDRYRIKPSCLVTYQVASRRWAAEILYDILSQNKCEIGAHLHPWNTPPLREEINERNSMLKNLPFDLQVDKLRVLTDSIQRAFGNRPRSFRAGRWGLGDDTVKALLECGYRVDSSVTPTISWKSSGDGPDYPEVKTAPYHLIPGGNGKGRDSETLLEVPATIGFNRWPFEFWQRIYSPMQRRPFRSLRAAGIVHRTGLLRKIWLSPEVSPAEDMIALSRIMIKNGLQFLNLNFHSTTLLPGKSPFVRNDKELRAFYAKIEQLLEYLTAATRLSSVTLSEVGDLYSNG